MKDERIRHGTMATERTRHGPTACGYYEREACKPVNEMRVGFKILKFSKD